MNHLDFFPYAGKRTLRPPQALSDILSKTVAAVPRSEGARAVSETEAELREMIPQ